MKIQLLANDINENSVTEMVTPMGLFYLAAFAEKYYPEKLEFTLQTRIDFVPDPQADLLAVSSMTRGYPKALELARQTKEACPHLPIIIGGCHISALPHTLPEVFDLAVLGEGEETFLELLQIFAAKGSFKPEDLAGVKGIAYHQDGKVVINPARPLIDPLDKIPIPKRDLWDISERVKWISSSRGCPFNCIFCALAQTRHRRFSAPRVMEEIMAVKQQYNPDLIVFQDDLFMLNKTRIEEIIKMMKQEGLKKDTCFGVTLRADLVDEETVHLLQEMNAKMVYMGIESGSEKILNYLKSGNLKLAQVEKALDLLTQGGIKVEGSFILGAPDETREDLLETYNFIFNHYKAGKLTFASINFLTPFPGGKLWKYAEDLGKVSEDMDFSRLELTLNQFDPYRSVYLNKQIPLAEFCDYVGFFEELHFGINQKTYQSLKESSREKYTKLRLDRDLLARFQKEQGYSG